VTTLVAVDPGEALVQVAAVEKAIQGFVLDTAMDVVGRPQLVGVPKDTAVRGTGPGVAGAIDLLLGCGVRAGTPSLGWSRGEQMRRLRRELVAGNRRVVEMADAADAQLLVQVLERAEKE